MTHTGEGNPTAYTWAGDDMYAHARHGTVTDQHTSDLSSGTITLYSHNLDGSHGGAHLHEEVSLMLRTNTSVVAWQDLRWSAPQHKASVELLERVWSPHGRIWQKYWPGSQPRGKRHGVFIAVRAPWSHRVVDSLDDPRGWARFGGVILQGASGDVAFISLYAPCLAGNAADVTWQRKQIANLGEGLTALDPWDLCLRDLRLKIMELQSAGVVVVLAGDTNVTWDLLNRRNAPDAAYIRHMKRWTKFARTLHLGNAMALREHTPAITFKRSNTSNDMDAVLVPTHLAETCLVSVGVLSPPRHETLEDPATAATDSEDPDDLNPASFQRPPSDSEHWPVVASFRFESVLGIDGEELQGIREAMGTQSSVRVPSSSSSSKIKVADEAACAKFRETVSARFQDRDFAESTRVLEARDDVHGDDYYKSVDSLFEDLLSVMRGTDGELTTRRQGTWRRNNDDGANDLRSELRASKSVFAATHATGGGGRRAKALLRVIGRSPETAEKLELTQRRVESWSDLDAEPSETATDVASLHAAARLLINDLSEGISRVTRSSCRRDLARKATKKDGRGRRCLRTLTDVVTARQRKGGHYASLVQEDTSSPPPASAAGRKAMKVTTNKEAVARALVKQFFTWMGGDRSWWHSDTALDKQDSEGRQLRRAILDGTLTDLETARIPARFRPVVTALRRVDGADETLYSTLMDPITEDEWQRKLGRVEEGTAPGPSGVIIGRMKKGTAPGLSGESIDMLASIDAASSDLLRRVINLMMRSRRVFSQWRRRAIVPIPKIRGNPDVALSRPITLLSVSGKCFWGIMSDRVASVWESRRLLQRQQYGFRRGVNTDEPLIIATLAAEQCYDLQQPLITVSQDISKAFDSVSRGMKALAFGRLGLPDEFCDMFALMDVCNRTVVVTAYGTSEEVLGEEGVFECARGYAQGCTSSANIGWVSFYDILLTLQNTIGIDGGTFRATGDEDGECDRSTLAFADDAFYLAGGACTSSPRRSAELKLAVASLFFDFSAIKMNSSKTTCCAMEWPEDSPAYTTAENDGWCPWTYDLDVLFEGGTLNLLPTDAPGGDDHICGTKSRREPITMIPVPDGMRYLGVWSSPRLDAEVTKKWVEETADELIDRVWQVPVDGAATRFLLEQILWSKVSYRLRYERFAVDAFDGLERRVRELLLHRSRLGVRMSKDAAAIPAVLGGPDIASWRDLVMADRLRVVQQHLDSNSTAAPLIRAAISRCQERFGSSYPVFESDSARHGGWLEPDTVEHGWIESLATWCAEQSITLHGGRGLPGAAIGDASIVDLQAYPFHVTNDDSPTPPPPAFVGPPPTTESDAESRASGDDGANADSTREAKRSLLLRGKLQRATFDMDQHFASDFLLLDGCTPNPDAAHYVKHRGVLRTFLRTALEPWASRPIPRFRGNDVKAGDVIFVRSGANIELAEVVSASGVEVRVDFLDRAQLKNTKQVAVGDSVFAKRRDTRCATYNWQPARVIRRPRNRRCVTVERPSGITDDSIPIDDACLQVFTADSRVWQEDETWTQTDTSSVWTKSNRQSVLHIGRAVRLPTSRFQCRGYFGLRISPGDFSRIATSLDALAASPPFSSSREAAVPDVAALLPQLGHDSYSSVVVERCAWQGGLDALREETTLFASDGAYNHIATGAWGLVTCCGDDVNLFSGRVDAGCGTNSPYRSEAYGLLAGLRYAHDAHVEGDIVHVLDNAAVVRVYQNCELRPQLVSSQDVWDEIIWYKSKLGPRYRVRWRRGHAEDRGALLDREDRANHLADGLAKAGYGATVDLRTSSFSHARRWHVRMDGLRPFDDIRSCARFHVGTRRLRRYYDKHQEDGRDLNVDILKAQCCGKSSKSSWCRSENAKFIHQQLATAHRLATWGVDGYTSPTCRACLDGVETGMHLLISCRAAACRAARRRFFDGVREFASTASSQVGDFLMRSLTIDDNGQLLCHGDTTAAFGLVTGFWPAGLRMALWADGCDDDKAGHAFILWFYKHCSKKLWRPTFEVAKMAPTCSPVTPFAATNDLTFDSSDDEVDVDPDTTGYTSDEYLDDNVRTTFADLPD